MAEESGLRGMVADEVSEQLDVADLLDGGTIGDGIDGDEIGASVGRQFGERVGRELGTAIGLKVHETISEGLEREKSLSEIRSDVSTAVREAFNETLEKREVADTLGLTTDEEDQEAEGDAADEGEAPTADSGETEAEDAEAEEPTEEAAEEADEPSAEDLEGLRRETLEEFLSIMSYSDLQSVAKDVGVKANLSREEMTERIAETVTESDDELAAAANEEGS